MGVNLLSHNLPIFFEWHACEALYFLLHFYTLHFFPHSKSTLYLDFALLSIINIIIKILICLSSQFQLFMYTINILHICIYSIILFLCALLCCLFASCCTSFVLFKEVLLSLMFCSVLLSIDINLEGGRKHFKS